jgi:hypothetical protein
MANSQESKDPVGSFETQTMVRRMKTYTIVDPELRNLWASTLMTTILLFFATVCLGVAISCLLAPMSIPDGAKLSSQTQTILLYGPRLGFIGGGLFFLLALLAWWFDYSVIRDVRKTSREGRLLAG